MAETKITQVTSTPETHEVLVKARGFWDKYSKPIIYIGSAVIILIAGWYAYLNFVKIPKEKEANNKIFPCEAIYDKMATSGFNKDSVNLALNGGAVEGKKVTGLLKIINEYGGTPAGNRAKYMAGTTYLQVKDFDKAIKYLKDFDAEGANQVQAAAYVALAHAYAEQNKTGDALDYYKKAATANDKDESLAPGYFMMAASYAQAIGKTQEAIDLYKKLKDKYPSSTSVSNGEVDKELASLGQIDN